MVAHWILKEQEETVTGEVPGSQQFCQISKRVSLCTRELAKRKNTIFQRGSSFHYQDWCEKWIGAEI